MNLVRFNGELWTTDEEMGYHVAIHSVTGSRFNIVPWFKVSLVGNNFKLRTATDTKESGPSSHES